jgi:YHS domain-containing protein
MKIRWGSASVVARVGDLTQLSSDGDLPILGESCVRASSSTELRGQTMSTVPAPVTREVVDPVCGMSIRVDDAVGQVTHRGETYYFCSQQCLERFRADPDRFLAPPAARDAHTHDASQGQEHTCAVDPEIRQAGPGACPKCGMALEPVLVAPTTKTEWTCPMHPEIVRDAPGSCPICGMAL